MLFRKILGLPIAAWTVAFLFFIKAAVLALWITPLWDIPDETGHFAYARDIASGKGILPLGEAEIGEDIKTHEKKSPSAAGKNWIVQHPPLYHIVAGAAWKMATVLTTDPEWRFRAPRLVSALFGALTLLFIFKIIGLACLGDKIGLAVMVGFSAIPMFSWLSSGTNHDTLVAFFGCVSAYYFIRFFQDGKTVSAYASVFFMSLAAATKMTALVALAPLVGLLAFEIPGSLKQWMKKAFTLIVVALAAPGIWLLRNFIEYGDPLATANKWLSGFRLQDSPLHTPFIEYLRTQPAIEHFFVNFVGLIGWRGTGLGNPTWFQIQTPFLTTYALGLFVVVFLAWLWLLFSVGGAYAEGRKKPHAFAPPIEKLQGGMSASFILPVALIFSAMALWVLLSAYQLVSVHVAPWLIVPSFSVLWALFVFSPLVFILSIEKKRRPIFYASIILAFFSFVVLWQVYQMFLLDGRMRATHGRYFYPVLGMIIIALVLPALLVLRRFAEYVALPAAAVVVCTEAAFYFLEVLPFVSGEGLK